MHGIPIFYQGEVDLPHRYCCIYIVIGFVFRMLLVVVRSNEINELPLLINVLVFRHSGYTWSGPLSQQHNVRHRDCRLSDVPLEGAVVPTQSRRAHLARSVNSLSSYVGGIKKK